jgi:TP53 regulating kinase-like protein
MILTSQNKIVFVDFGLSERSKELEARGVDLHLMKRALQSTHYKHVKECFGAVMEGYARIVGDDVAREVLKKIQEIESRGRYVSERK